jgi:hypothetical protein
MGPGPLARPAAMPQPTCQIGNEIGLHPVPCLLDRTRRGNRPFEAWASTSARWTISAVKQRRRKRPAGARRMPKCFEDAERLIAAWNERQEERMPMLFSPTIGAAITAGYWFLWVRCPACRTINAIDLRKLDRPRRREAAGGQPREPLHHPIFLPRNAIKKTAPTAAARIRFTYKVCIFKHLRQTRFDNPQTGAGTLTRRHGVLIGTRAQRVESRPLWQHNHLAVADLMFRKDLRTGFRMYFNFRVRKARLDRLDRLDFVGNGDKK